MNIKIQNFRLFPFGLLINLLAKSIKIRPISSNLIFSILMLFDIAYEFDVLLIVH